MATIGTFKKSGNEYTGDIVTLNVQAKNVRIVPETNHSSDNAPSHRVLVGRDVPGSSVSATTRRLNAFEQFRRLRLPCSATISVRVI